MAKFDMRPGQCSFPVLLPDYHVRLGGDLRNIPSASR
jgi:hypothetical protein